MSDTFFYHVVPGEKTSKKIFLTKEELYKVEKVYSDVVSKNYRKGVYTPGAQRVAAKLLAVSYWILGGHDPCYPSKEHPKGSNVLLPTKYRQEYVSFFCEEAIKALVKFDRSKGCWTQYVKWSRGKALRRVISLMRREENYERSLVELTEYVTYHALGTCCFDEPYSEETEEITLKKGKNDEIEQKDTDSMGGSLGGQ